MDAPNNPPNGGGGGDDAPERRKLVDPGEDAQGVVDVFGDSNELPVLVFVFLAAIANQTLASMFYYRC